MPGDAEILNRAALLLGEGAMSRLSDARVILFGIGGVGSWCAECLARTGIGHLTIVDCDCVAPSNINRQLEATCETIGIPKVEAMRQRLLEIRPRMEITAVNAVFSPDTAGDFNLDSYDCIIDAIDSLRDKQLLIERATATRALFLSSMGAALKKDPSHIRVAEFWKVTGCSLARALRQRFRKAGTHPRRKFLCVYSDEPVADICRQADSTAHSIGTQETENTAAGVIKRVNGSLMQITAIFGITLAAQAINHLTDQR